MARLNILVFILLYNGSFCCLIFDSRRHFFIWGIIHFIGLPLLGINFDFVFLAKNRNKIFVLLEMLSQYPLTVIIRYAFRTLSNKMDLFAKVGNGF